MPRLRRLLFPTDFSSAGEPALQQALLLARRHGAELVVLHVAEVGDYYFEEDEGFREEVERRMQHFLDGHDFAGLTVRSVIEHGETAGPGILRYARENDVDLIVIGTHGRRGFRRLLMGSVAETVVREAPCPVYAVRSEGAKLPAEGFNHILVPLDLSQTGPRAVEHACDLAETYGADLHLAHVFEKLDMPAVYGDIESPLPEAIPDVRERVETEMRRIRGEAEGCSAETHYHLLEGDAAEQIVEFADGNPINLIVLSSYGHSELERFFIGGVAAKVVRGAPCPVYVVR